MISLMFCDGLLNMEVILNATLAGGVIMGAAADIINDPYRPMIAGWFIGVVSALGFLYLSPLLKNRIGLHDSCGVLNLHGIPGILGSFVVAISTSNNAIDNFGVNFEDLYPAYGRTPMK